MLAGHYATSLIAYQKFPKGTLLFFLIAAQLQDFLWLCFHYLGLEPTLPSDVLQTSLPSLNVNMLFSHDLLPQFVWGGLIFLVGLWLFKSKKIALIALALFVVHFVLDFFSGYPHHIFGEDTHQVGLGLYYENAVLAVSIEAVFTAIVLWIFFSNEKKAGQEWSRGQRASVIGLFVIGIAFMLSISKQSFSALFGLPPFDLGFNTTVPTLIITYVMMVVVLYFAVPKRQ